MGSGKGRRTGKWRRRVVKGGGGKTFFALWPVSAEVALGRLLGNSGDKDRERKRERSWDAWGILLSLLPPRRQSWRDITAVCSNAVFSDYALTWEKRNNLGGTRRDRNLPLRHSLPILLFVPEATTFRSPALKTKQRKTRKKQHAYFPSKEKFKKVHMPQSGSYAVWLFLEKWSL